MTERVQLRSFQSALICGSYLCALGGSARDNLRIRTDVEACGLRRHKILFLIETFSNISRISGVRDSARTVRAGVLARRRERYDAFCVRMGNFRGNTGGVSFY